MRDLKQETSDFVGILVFMSSWNFMLSWFEHEKGFITSGPGSKGDVKNQGQNEKLWGIWQRLMHWKKCLIIIIA